MHAANQLAYTAGSDAPKTKVAGGYQTTTATSKDSNPIFAWGLNENNVPTELLPKARAWFQRRMDYYAAKHGSAWADTREWIADYINEELREHLARKGGMA